MYFNKCFSCTVLQDVWGLLGRPDGIHQKQVQVLYCTDLITSKIIWVHPLTVISRLQRYMKKCMSAAGHSILSFLCCWMGLINCDQAWAIRCFAGEMNITSRIIYMVLFFWSSIRSERHIQSSRNNSCMPCQLRFARSPVLGWPNGNSLCIWSTPSDSPLWRLLL